MKGKVKHIVGIVAGAVLLPACAYATLMFYVALALVVGLGEEGFNSEAGKLLALTIVAGLLMIGALVLLIVCAVKLAKINKEEKALKLSNATPTPDESTIAEEKAEATEE